MIFSFLIRQRAISSRMSMCLLNARSINNKALFIKDYVVDHQIDILGTTETWTKSDGESNRVVNELSPRDILSSNTEKKTIWWWYWPVI